MSVDRMLVVIAKAGTPLGPGAIVTAQALKELAAMAATPYLKFREEHGDLVWDGPSDAYLDYFQHPAAVQEAQSAINRAMRK